MGATAERRGLKPLLRLSSISLYSQDMADAMALIDGRVTECLARKNSFVHKGDPIFIIENENISLEIEEADANILKAEAEFKRTKNNFERYTKLRAADAVSATQYDEAESSYVAARAGLAAARSRKSQLLVQKSRAEVVSPLDGKVLMLYHQPGAYVKNGTPLALVGDFRYLYFTAPLEDKETRHLFIGQRFDLVFHGRELMMVYGTGIEKDNRGDNGKGENRSFSVTVREITPPLSEKATMRNVVWRIDNRSGLLEPQTYGDVSFESDRAEVAIVVPLSAMTDRTRSAVFVAEDGVLSRREVKTGNDDGKYIEVISGLKEGEIVIISGKEGLTDGMPVDVTLDKSSGRDGSSEEVK